MNYGETKLRYRAPKQSDDNEEISDTDLELYEKKIPAQFGEEYTFKVLFSTVDLQIRSKGQLFRHKMISKETEPKTCTALFTPTGTYQKLNLFSIHFFIYLHPRFKGKYGDRQQHYSLLDKI